AHRRAQARRAQAGHEPPPHVALELLPRVLLEVLREDAEQVAREAGALVPPPAGVHRGHAAGGLDDRRERDAERLPDLARLLVDRLGEERGGEEVPAGPEL